MTEIEQLNAKLEAAAQECEEMAAMVQHIHNCRQRDLARARAEAMEEAAQQADLWAKTKPDLERSTNERMARLIATIISDTATKIARGLRALSQSPRPESEACPTCGGNCGQCGRTGAQSRSESGSAGAPRACEPGETEWQATHQHRKGGLYRELCRGRLEADVDQEMVVYEGIDTSIWIRPAAEFDDGRFTALHSPRAKEGE
jgi:hypothetical protein